jgi:ceramide glucosyltransferase
MNTSPVSFIVLLALALLALGITTLAQALTWFQVRRRGRTNRLAVSTAAVPTTSAPKLTILKPLCGIDAALDDNLNTIAAQSYRNFDVVFGVADTTEPALLNAQRFSRQFQTPTTRVSIGETSGCINPKVSLLARMVSTYEHGAGTREQCGGRPTHRDVWTETEHWYVVSDSNVQLQPNYLAEAVGHMGSEVGIVTHLVAGHGGDNVAAVFENLQINVCITPAVAFVRFFTGRTCVIGKSIFIRADVLRILGGFEAIGHVLAEDYLLGRQVERAGFKVVVSRQSVRAWHQDWSFARFLNRHGRWACMRRNISLTGYLLEPLLSPSVFVSCAWLLGANASELGWDVDLLGLGLLWSMLLSTVTTRVLTGEWPGVASVLLNPLREWVTLAIWSKGWFIREIDWRGKRYRVVGDSVLHPINQEFDRGDEVPVP